jgi:hypothetical protein
MIRTLRNTAVLIAAAAVMSACSGGSPTATPAGPSMDGGITWGSGNGVGTGGGGADGTTTTSTTTAADSGSTARGGITWGSGN